MTFLGTVSDSLTTLFGDMGPVIGLLGLAVLLIAGSLPVLLKKPVEPFDKIKALRQSADLVVRPPRIDREETGCMCCGD